MTQPEVDQAIVILGGGTAGWIAACLIAHRWPDARVTLVESPEIGIVGVGEGSTPQLKALFDQLGISEAEWMPACDATYKLGIGFEGWSDRPGFDRYFHAFPTALDRHTADAFFYNTRARRTGRDVVAHPDRFLLPARLADAACAPQPDGNFPFEISYGYHFDAYKVGAFLARHAVEKRGVMHLQRRVTGVERATDGGITALLCEDGAPVAGDLFVDSSGFRSVLFEQTLGVPFVRYADTLFNDAAVVLPTPRDPAAPLASQTRATALSAGWVWDIPLTTRSGNGYVYSSRHISPEQAETELRAHLGGGDDGSTARHLTMRVGRVAESWSHNALAVGLAQGFLEPLEATALHLVIATVEAFLDAVDADGFTAKARTPFNARIAARYDGVRDYIVAHYRLNQRHDDPHGYWAAARAVEPSDTLKRVMSAWFTGGDLAAEIERLDLGRYYSAISWHCLFAGYGTFPEDARLVAPGPDIDRIDMARIDDFLSRCARNFQPHQTHLPR